VVEDNQEEQDDPHQIAEHSELNVGNHLGLLLIVWCLKTILI